MPDGSVHLVDGERVLVRRNRRRRRNAAIFREGGQAVLELPAGVASTAEADWVTTMLRRLHAHEQRNRRPRSDELLLARALTVRADHLLPLAPDAPVPVAVTWSQVQQRRWGSCTPAARTIRLSSRLKDLPQWVVDYVLLHELAHLVVPGHGEAFWALLTGYPRTEEAKGWLAGYAAGLAAPSGEPMAGEIDEDGD